MKNITVLFIALVALVAISEVCAKPPPPKPVGPGNAAKSPHHHVPKPVPEPVSETEEANDADKSLNEDESSDINLIAKQDSESTSIVPSSIEHSTSELVSELITVASQE